MDAFSEYVHVTDNVQLANRISDRCQYHLNQCQPSDKYQGEKTTFFDKTILNDVELDALYNYILEQSREFCYIIGVDVNLVHPVISSLWISTIGYHGNHPYHTHCPDSHISGTFYVNIDAGSAPITFLSRFFYNDVWYNLPFIKKNQYSAPSIKIPPINGRLIMWKSDLIHGVLRNETKIRVAISFNILLQRK